MLNYKSSLIEDKKYSGLSIKEISPVMKLNLRGKSREFLSTIGKNINMILPIEANTSSSSDKYTSMWLSPDEWMMISNNVIDKEIAGYKILNTLLEVFTNSVENYKTGVTTQFDQLILDDLILGNPDETSMYQFLIEVCNYISRLTDSNAMLNFHKINGNLI